MSKKTPTKYYIGIDPGFSGAVGFVSDTDNSDCGVFDAPIIEKQKGGKVSRKFDVDRMVGLLSIEKFLDSKSVIAIEGQHAFPGQGSVSMFNLGYGFGLWTGIANALKYRVVIFSPQAWKNELIKTDCSNKLKSIQVATKKFPSMADELSRKKDHNRAEALLIALYSKMIDRQGTLFES